MFLQGTEHFLNIRTGQTQLLASAFEEGAGGDEVQVLAGVVHQPDGDGKHLKNVRNQVDGGAAQIHLVDAGGHAFGQASPDSAVIVHRPLKRAAEAAPGVERAVDGEVE